MQPTNKTLREFLITLNSLVIINDNLKSFSKRPFEAKKKTTGGSNRSKGDVDDSMLAKSSKEKSRLSELKSNRSVASALNDEPVPNELTNEEKLTVLESALDSLRKEASLDKTTTDLTKLSMRTASAKTAPPAAEEGSKPAEEDKGTAQDEQKNIDKILEDFYSIK